MQNAPMKGVPLCELHVHLEGCVTPQHVKTWWKRSEFLFPPPSYADGSSSGFDRFLEHLRFGYNFLNTEDAYAAVALDYAKRAVEQGICYAEVQINSALLKTWGLDIVPVLSRINEACGTLQNAPILRFIIDLPWQFNAYALKTLLRRVDILTDLGVRAISMGGDEALARPLEVQPTFRAARESGLKAVCHAGETTCADTARSIIETLEPDRVTHGVTAADWIRSLGPQAPPIDVCLTSNLMLGVIPSLKDHPLEGWVAAGVPVTLSTDDPALFRVTLADEYRRARLICPGLVNDCERLEAMWIRSACDPEAASTALTAAKAQRTWWSKHRPW